MLVLPYLKHSREVNYHIARDSLAHISKRSDLHIYFLGEIVRNDKRICAQILIIIYLDELAESFLIEVIFGLFRNLLSDPEFGERTSILLIIYEKLF